MNILFTPHNPFLFLCTAYVLIYPSPDCSPFQVLPIGLYSHGKRSVLDLLIYVLPLKFQTPPQGRETTFVCSIYEIVNHSASPTKVFHTS